MHIYSQIGHNTSTNIIVNGNCFLYFFAMTSMAESKRVFKSQTALKMKMNERPM